MQKNAERVRLWVLGYLAPAVFVGALCLGFMTYGWMKTGIGDSQILAERAGKNSGGNTFIAPEAAVIDQEPPMSNPQGQEIDAAPQTEGVAVNKVQSSAEDLVTVATNWPVGSFELPIFWGTGREILRPYGLSYAATYGDYRFHSGWDFKLGMNEEVLSSAPGVVSKVDYSQADKYSVQIRHSGGWESRYQQLDQVSVAVDEQVGLNQVIGSVGEPGTQEQAEGPHLHWELWLDGVRQNPAKHIELNNLSE